MAYLNSKLISAGWKSSENHWNHIPHRYARTLESSHYHLEVAATDNLLQGLIAGFRNQDKAQGASEDL